MKKIMVSVLFCIIVSVFMTACSSSEEYDLTKLENKKNEDIEYIDAQVKDIREPMVTVHMNLNLTESEKQEQLARFNAKLNSLHQQKTDVNAKYLLKKKKALKKARKQH